MTGTYASAENYGIWGRLLINGVNEMKDGGTYTTSD